MFLEMSPAVRAAKIHTPDRATARGADMFLWNTGFLSRQKCRGQSYSSQNQRAPEQDYDKVPAAASPAPTAIHYKLSVYRAGIAGPMSCPFRLVVFLVIAPPLYRLTMLYFMSFLPG